MRFLLIAAAIAAVSNVLFAQDRVTLANGDALTGVIKTMADGKLVITSPLLGDVTVPLPNVKDIATQDVVALETVTGETWKRRIAGIEAGVLRLDGDVPSLPLANLSRINPPAVEPPKWTGSLTLSGLFSDGNTERRSVGAAFEASRRTDMDRITTDGVWDYAEDRSTAGGDWDLTQRRAGAGLKYDYLLGKRWYALTTARVLGDTFADLDLRFTGGAGLGYTVIDIDTTTLLTEAGLSYFNENYRSATPSTDYVAARVAYKVNHKLSEATKLAHGVEAFPSLESADDVYFQMKTEVVTTVAEGMIASLGWVWDYDNTPSPGLERSDHRVLLSIGWSF